MSDSDRQAHDRIADALARRGADARAPADFDDRLWAAIDAPPARRASRLYAVAAVVAIAAAVALAWSLWPDRTGPQQPDALAVYVRRGRDAPKRSTTAAPGDVLQVAGHVGDASHVEIRLYRDNRLVVSCTDRPPCERRGSRITARVPLASRGRYDVALVRARSPLPSAVADQDRDLAAAIEAGAEVTTSRVVVE